MKNLHKGLCALCCVMLISVSNLTFADSTYLRCFYRIAPGDPTNVAVTHVRAQNEKLSGDYEVIGSWWSGGLILANMFYTSIPYKTLKTRCEETLKSKGITTPLVMFAAANNYKSYNYLVWNVDAKSDSKKIDRIVAFGDSLSDTNNFLNGRGWLEQASNKSYYAGRFTNGKNWLDYLSDYFDLPVYNWAIAGAATQDYDIAGGGTGQWNKYGIKVNSIVSQVNSWITYMNVDSNKFYNPENTLFTMLIGGNDLLTYGIKVDTMISQEKLALTRLITDGRAKNIVLFKLPDLSRTPVFALRKPDPRDPKSDPNQVKAQVEDFNKKLLLLAADLRTQFGNKVNIQVFDTYSMFTNLVKRPTGYGLTNTTDSCLEISAESIDTYSKEGSFRKICVDAPKKADSFLYYDLMHPTTHTHKILAGQVFCLLKNKYTRVLPPSSKTAGAPRGCANS